MVIANNHRSYLYLWFIACLVLGGGCKEKPSTQPLQNTAPKPVKIALKRLWKISLESSWAAPAVVVDSVAYLGDADGTFHAYKMNDGNELWAKSFENCAFLAGAFYHSGKLYIGDDIGIVRCINASNGDLIWSIDTGSEFHAAPNLVNDQLLLAGEDGSLRSLSPSDGSEQWTFQIEAPLRCQPVVVAGHVLLAGCDKKLHAVTLKSGEEVAALEIDAPTGNTPTIVKNRAYFGTEAGTMVGVEISSEARDASREVGAAVELIGLWEQRDPKRRQPVRGAAALHNQTVFFANQGKGIYALDLTKNGKIIWQTTARSKIESSLATFNGHLVVATYRGRVLLLDGKNGDNIWEYEAGGSFSAPPVVVGQRIIIGNDDGTLYCFEKE